MKRKTKRPAKRKARGKFCVIAVTAFRRRWFDTEAEAIAHARPMIKEIKEDQSHDRTSRVMVVQAVKLVEEAPCPIVSRNPSDADFTPTADEARRLARVERFHRERRGERIPL